MRAGIGKTVVLALALLWMFTMAALSETPVLDETRTGSITISRKTETDQQVAADGGIFRLFWVADIVMKNHNMSFVYTEDVENCGMPLEERNSELFATHLAVFAKQNGIPNTSLVMEGTSVRFDNLPLGLYLILEEEDSQAYYPIAPFLVSIPYTDERGERWIYDVDASPKVDPRPDAPAQKELSVQKIWENQGACVPDCIMVVLLKDGQEVERKELNNANNWAWTWEGLDGGFSWNVIEDPVPKGYAVSYQTEGQTVLITNTATGEVPQNPVDVSVRKIWDDSGKNRPNAIKVLLQNDGEIMDTVVLNQDNHWQYTWEALDAQGKWEVREDNVPEGYKASYKRNGNLVTITNSKHLIQTGQLAWPIPILAIAGVISFAVGWVLYHGRKRV